MSKKLTLQTAILGSGKTDGPLAVASSPLDVDTDQPLYQIVNDMMDGSFQNNVALINALKKQPLVPPSAEPGMATVLLEMYRKFESGEFAMVTCHRFPCPGDTDDHCLVVRFTPPKI